MDKKVLRKKMLEKRSQLSLEKIEEKSKIIANNLFNLNQYKKANFIFSFISFKDEVNTHEIIKKSISIGKRVGVPIPVPKTKELKVSELIDFDKELDLGFYNILTPKDKYIRIVPPQLVDLVLVPGVAFDKRGYRVGYGGGYYDRFFNNINKDIIKIGLCYEMQILSEVPKNSHDIPIDFILTEKRLIQCAKEKI
ncbi:MAG: 5-formyltetrahydrofolate cyclo-ligase [Tissierellia bacterium]|nr:5-formyltetrahydrofolate cyclo-ligase [Tissierellia bacterium]